MGKTWKGYQPPHSGGFPRLPDQPRWSCPEPQIAPPLPTTLASSCCQGRRDTDTQHSVVSGVAAVSALNKQTTTVQIVRLLNNFVHLYRKKPALTRRETPKNQGVKGSIAGGDAHTPEPAAPEPALGVVAGPDGGAQAPGRIAERAAAHHPILRKEKTTEIVPIPHLPE
jgi:hypothetical protein